jgi:hypothetical protein
VLRRRCPTSAWTEPAVPSSETAKSSATVPTALNCYRQQTPHDELSHHTVRMHVSLCFVIWGHAVPEGRGFETQ